MNHSKVFKATKIPVEIEAIQYNGDERENIHEVQKFLGSNTIPYVCLGTGSRFLEIHTLEGTMRADEGDYIIKGVNGEFYPCKPDIFRKTYTWEGKNDEE